MLSFSAGSEEALRASFRSEGSEEVPCTSLFSADSEEAPCASLFSEEALSASSFAAPLSVCAPAPDWLLREAAPLPDKF